MTDAERWLIIRGLLGYVADGSNRTVTIMQDDATKEWIMKVGKHHYWGVTLDEVLTLAKLSTG